MCQIKALYTVEVVIFLLGCCIRTIADMHNLAIKMMYGRITCQIIVFLEMQY